MSTDFLPSYLEITKDEAPAGARRERPTAFLLHGILGSATNWRSFARRLVENLPSASRLRWILVDLRGHGDSEPGPPPHTVDACARDVARLATVVGPAELVIGHSFGGKVALQLAAHHSPRTRAAWILDTPPGPAEASQRMDEISRVFAMIDDLPDPLPGRAEVAAAIQERGLSKSLAQWMTTNVRGTAETGYHWKFDLPTVRALIDDYARLDTWPIVERPRPGLKVHAVRGARSDRFSAEDKARLARIGELVIPDAGHWLHVDAPDALARLFEAAAAEVIR